MYISPLGDSSPVPASAAVLKQAELLQTAPFVFPFIERVKVPNLLSYTPSDSTYGYTAMSNVTVACFVSCSSSVNWWHMIRGQCRATCRTSYWGQASM